MTTGNGSGEAAVSAPNRRRLRRVYGLSLLAILAFGLAPAASVLVAGLIATTAGCVLNEGNVHPCVIAGADIGHLLYTMAVFGWLMLLTIPASGILLVCWAVALAIHAVRRGPGHQPPASRGRN